MRIIIDTIAHGDQRYPSVGDWTFDDDGTMHIYVSDMENDDYAFLVAIHEMVEAKLCQKRGITDESVTAFDEAFEAKRGPGDFSEPGDDPTAPYCAEHNFATGIERLMCAELGINWFDYEQAVRRLSP